MTRSDVVNVELLLNCDLCHVHCLAHLLNLSSFGRNFLHSRVLSLSFLCFKSFLLRTLLHLDKETLLLLSFGLLWSLINYFLVVSSIFCAVAFFFTVVLPKRRVRS